jgi:hypothetical protein
MDRHGTPQAETKPELIEPSARNIDAIAALEREALRERSARALLGSGRCAVAVFAL